MIPLNEQIAVIGLPNIAEVVALMLAFLVSLLTLYNAAKLKTGVLAVSTYSFGAGMLALSLGFLTLAAPAWADKEVMSLVYYLLFTLGFALLGFGSYKIYQMSQVK